MAALNMSRIILIYMGPEGNEDTTKIVNKVGN
jgi:hypothetical protein